MASNIIHMDENFDTSAYPSMPIEAAINAGSGTECLIHAYLGIVEKTATNGSKYLQLLLSDNARHSVSELMFSNDSRYSFFEPYIGDRIEAEIACKLVKNGKYLNMNIRNADLYLPMPIEPEVEAEASVTRMEKIKRYMDMIASSFMREVVRGVYNTPGFAEKMLSVPATQYSGYAYPGGLADLILVSCDFAHDIALSINQSVSTDNGLAVNPDLLLAGSLLCYVGKAYMLDWTDEGKTRIDKTERGIIDNELMIAHNMTEMVIHNLAELKDDDGNPKYDIHKDSCTELLHMIDSCKNQVQWGALSTPRTKHAMFLSNICQMAFAKGLFESLEARQDGPDGTMRFAKAYDDGRMYFLPDSHMDI